MKGKMTKFKHFDIYNVQKHKNAVDSYTVIQTKDNEANSFKEGLVIQITKTSCQDNVLCFIILDSSLHCCHVQLNVSFSGRARYPKERLDNETT